MEWIDVHQKAGKLPKPAKIALLWENTSHGKDFQKGITDFVARSGGAYQIAVDESFALDGKDFSALLGKVKAAGVDLFLADAHLPDYITMHRQYVSAGMCHKVVTYGARGSEKGAIEALVQENVNYVLSGVWWSPQLGAKNALAREFVDAFKARYGGRSPEWFQALGYEAARALFTAIQQAGAVDREKVRQKLSELKMPSLLPGGTLEFPAATGQQAQNPFVLQQNVPEGGGSVWICDTVPTAWRMHEVRDGIAYITMNRPEKHNATRHLEYELLGQYVREADRDDNVRAVIISGRGKSFSLSDDVQGMKTEGLSTVSEPIYQHYADQDWAEWVGQGEPIGPFQDMARLMLESGKIFIAAVQGLCLLTEITHPCDFVIAAEDAMFSQPDIVISQNSSGSATVVLPRLLGRRRALEIFLDPTPFSAQEAYRRGMVNKVVPLPDLMAEAEALARKLIIYNPKTIGNPGIVPEQTQLRVGPERLEQCGGRDSEPRRKIGQRHAARTRLGGEESRRLRNRGVAQGLEPRARPFGRVSTFRRQGIQDEAPPPVVAGE